jgi:hypothetical protein
VITPRATALLRLALGLCLGFAGACGKRGNPQPPLRPTPQPVSALRVAQMGALIEVSAQAPRAGTDGSSLPVLELELLTAQVAGDFPKVARGQLRRVAPGETLIETLPLPEPGTMLRVAARAVSKGRSSVLTSVVTLKVRAEVEPPSGLTARSAAKGVHLAWDAPRVMPTPEPKPVPTPKPELPAPTTSGGPSPTATPAMAERPAPTPAPEPATADPKATSPSPAPKPTPVPTPQPPSTGFHVYRRAKGGSWGRPLEAIPVPSPSYDDTTPVPGQTWCYSVRTVAAADPPAESAATDEACLTFEDVTPPAAPSGLAVLPRDGELEVSWSPSGEPDLAGYRLYRARRGAAAERLAGVDKDTTSYRDLAAEPGVVYVYTVRALDTGGNESLPSSPAQGSRP